MAASPKSSPTPPTPPMLQYHLTDHLGSITTTLTTSGTPTASFYFDPYGRRINADGTPSTGTTSDTSHGFTGHEHDDSPGLINMKGRLYDPSHSTFPAPPTPSSSAPPTASSYNPYSYVSNSPLNYTDPTGYITCAFVHEGNAKSPGAAPAPPGGCPLLHGDGSRLDWRQARRLVRQSGRRGQLWRLPRKRERPLAPSRSRRTRGLSQATQGRESARAKRTEHHRRNIRRRWDARFF